MENITTLRPNLKYWKWLLPVAGPKLVMEQSGIFLHSSVVVCKAVKIFRLFLKHFKRLKDSHIPLIYFSLQKEK